MTVYIHPPVPYGNIILEWTLLHNISSTYDVVDCTYRARLVAEGRLLWTWRRLFYQVSKCIHQDPSRDADNPSHYAVRVITITITTSSSATCIRSTFFQSHVLQIRFNIVLPSAAVPPEWSLPFSSSDQYFACIFHFFHASYTPNQSHISCYDHHNESFLWTLKTKNLHYLYVTFSSSSYYLQIACISSAPCLQTF